MRRVGSKGQIVIEKQWRDRLGIGPGWSAVQAVRGNELVVRFEPPPHQRSLAGVLREYAAETAPPGREQMDAAVAEAIVRDWREEAPTGDSGT